MNCPELTEAQNDKTYREYLEGYSKGPVGFLMLIAGLERIYEMTDKEVNNKHGRFTR